MPIHEIAGPAAEPITLEQAKAHLRVTGSDDDVYISALIRAARKMAEDYTGRALVTRVNDWIMDGFPGGSYCPLVPPAQPLRKVASISYVEPDGDSVTWSSTGYNVDIRRDPGEILPAYQDIWPVTRDYVNVATVRYTGGYATPFTASTSDNTLTAPNHPYSDGDRVPVSSSNTLPAGLSLNTDYYVINSDSGSLQLSTSTGGSAVDITDTGTGTHFLGVIPEEIQQAMHYAITFWYDNRMDSEKPVTPMTAHFLLRNYKVEMLA